MAQHAAIPTTSAAPASGAAKDGPVDPDFDRALALQFAGQLDLAEQAFRAILERQAGHAAAHHCLGMLLVRARQPAAGLSHLLAALGAEPDNAGYWLGYIEALLQADQIEAARTVVALVRGRGLEGPAIDEFESRLSGPLPASVLVSAPRNAARDRTYVIVAPAYTHRSAGIRVLHTLCDDLNQLGRVAHIIFYRFRPGGPEFYTPAGTSEYCAELRHIPPLPASTDINAFRDVIDGSIVVYPEVILGNPLNARHVVRYVLNHPEANGYPMLEGNRDFIVGFNTKYWQKPHAIACMMFEDPLFHDRDAPPGLERRMDCTYIGKGANHGQCFRIPGSVHIQRDSPADKEGLAIMLRNTRYLFSWDVNTQTNADALLCGAVIVVPRWEPFTRSSFDTDFGPIPFAESRIVGDAIQIFELADDYDSKRARFIASVKATARARPQTVERLVREMEGYFGALEMTV